MPCRIELDSRQLLSQRVISPRRRALMAAAPQGSHRRPASRRAERAGARLPGRRRIPPRTLPRGSRPNRSRAPRLRARRPAAQPRLHRPAARSPAPPPSGTLGAVLAARRRPARVVRARSNTRRGDPLTSPARACRRLDGGAGRLGSLISSSSLARNVTRHLPACMLLL